jgi:hypothetical protein
VDKARLRENARIVRTLREELRAAVKPRNERFQKEAYEKVQAACEKGEKVDWGQENEQTKIDAAESRLFGALINAFLDLTEELAGDIAQDLGRGRIRGAPPARRASRCAANFPAPS